MRLLTILIAASGLFAIIPMAGAQPRDGAAEQEILSRINSLRSAARVAPLSRDSALDAAALTHSTDLAWHGELVHVSERTGDPASRVSAAGFSAGSIGENIATAQSAAEAQTSLVASAPHLANMLNGDYTHVGIAAVRNDDDGDVWVTQVFANVSDETDDTPANVLPVPPTEYQAGAASTATGSLEAAAEGGEFAEGELSEGRDAVLFAGGAAAGGASALGAGGLQAPLVAGAPGERAETVPAQVPQQARRAAAANEQVEDPTISVPGPDRSSGAPVVGYWIFHGERWWYFPLPADAQPGDRLEPDLSVVGPPPDGYAQPAPPARRPRHFRGGPPRGQGGRPAFGWSPRRHYQNWRNSR